MPSPTPSPTNRVLGIDASHYQGVLPWAKFPEAEIRFAYLKATQGTSWFDPQFGQNASSCPAETPLGAYHYFDPGRDPTAQAQHFHNVAAEISTLRPMLDFETTRGAEPVVAAQRALECAKVTANLWNCRVILYSYQSFLVDGFARLPGGQDVLSALAEECDLWLAWYRSTEPPAPAPWSDWALWQFDGDGGRRLPNGVDADFNWAKNIEALRR